MAGYEYTVIPAPAKGVKAKGVKTPEARFAFALQELMNQMGAEGWEYQRAETLPSLERSGLTGSTTAWRHVLVFRRPLVAEAETAPEEPLKLIEKQAPTPPPPEVTEAPEPAPEPEPEPQPDPQPEDDPHPAGQPGATQMLRDNGVEDTSEVAGVSTSLTNLAKSRKSPFDSDP